MFRFPYTNLHELNLDWILQQVKKFAELIPPMEDATTNVQEALDKAEEALNDAEQAMEDAGDALTIAQDAKDIAEQAAQGIIADGAVTTPKLDDEAVTTAKIDDDAVTTAKIDDGAVTTAKLDDESVTTAKLDDESVTTAKLDDESVTTAKLGDESVTTAKIDDGAVTNPKLADNSVTKVKLDMSTVSGIFTTESFTIPFNWYSTANPVTSPAVNYTITTLTGKKAVAIAGYNILGSSSSFCNISMIQLNIGTQGIDFCVRMQGATPTTIDQNSMYVTCLCVDTV